VPCGLPPRHPPAGLPASGCRDGVRPARCRPPPGPYERWTRRASGAYDSVATVCVMHAGLLASDGCFSSGLTALIDVLLGGAGPATRRRPFDPGGPRRCHRRRPRDHHGGRADRPGDDAPARPAGRRRRRGAGAGDHDRRGHAHRPGEMRPWRGLLPPAGRDEVGKCPLAQLEPVLRSAILGDLDVAVARVSEQEPPARQAVARASRIPPAIRTPVRRRRRGRGT
jgi:hypothetical protein